MIGLESPPEVVLAQAAATLQRPDGSAVSPPVQALIDGRPRLRRVPGARLSEACEDVSSLEQGVLTTTGAVLARLHRQPCPVTRVAIAEVPPFDPISYAEYAGLADGQRSLLARLHRDERLCADLRQTFAEVAAGAQWCHADARPDNVVIGPHGPQLVDWERSGRGRPELDVGVLVAGLLSIHLARAVALTDSASALRSRINAALLVGRDSTAAVLSGYGHDLDPSLLARVAGAGLLTRAYVRAGFGPMDRAAELMYGIGVGLVANPDRWAGFTHDRPEGGH